MRQARERAVRPGAYGVLYLLFASALLLAHLPWIGLPYFWDEAGYYIPAALDFFHGASLIAHSVAPSIHPPGLSIYLSTVWALTGFHIESTRCAMLALAAAAALCGMLLAIELLRDARGMPALLAAAMVCLSPVFFAQAMLAQTDMPAMLFTSLALWLFLRDRTGLAVLACAALVIVKETGIAAPLVFSAWLAHERRWREAAWFLAPVAVLMAWVATVAHATGHWAGNIQFLNYNLLYPLHPGRIAADVFRRLYYLFGANLHWIGAFAILFAWRTSAIFRGRNWRVAATFAAVHTALVTLLGGATLERYLLPVLPILYAAMAAGISLFPRRPRLLCSAALLAGLGAGIFVNPPYPFPLEDNLAWTSFVRLQSAAADYLNDWYSGARIASAWPLSAELSLPELGYTDRHLSVETLNDPTPASLQRFDWASAGVVAIFSREWDPPLSPLRIALFRRLWGALFAYAPLATEEEVRRIAPYPAAVHWERNGQWMDLYINPRQAVTPPEKRLHALRK